MRTFAPRKTLISRTATPGTLLSGTLASAIAATGLAVAPVAFGQQATLEEVIVSARKMEESLQDVSIAVTAFSGDQLDALIMRDVRELEGLVPNLVIDAVAVSPAGASVYIRGVGTQEVERSFDPAVGVVIDGVPLSFVNGSMRNTFDFARMEVLRGPQGTLFGRNTTGGVININRTKPTGEWGLKYELTGGTDDLLDAKLVANIPLGDMFAGKLGYAVQQDGSDRTNTVLNRDVGNPDNEEFNATLAFRPSEDFEAVFTYVNYQDQNDGVPLSNRAALNTDNPVNPVPEVVCGLVGLCDDPGKDITEFQQDFYSRDIDFEWDSYTLNMDYDVGAGVISAIIGYQETDELVPTDFDATPVNTFHTLRAQESEQTSAEIRFASSDALSEDWNFVAGLFWVEDEYQLDQKTSITAALGPDAALFQNPLADHEREAWAVFGEFHWDITDRMMLILGGRYTEEEKDYTGSIFFGGGAGNGLPGYMAGTEDDFFIFGVPIWVPTGSASGNESWEEFTPKVGLDYRLSDEVLTYFTYSEGFRSGGFNGRNQSPDNIGPFDPEYVANWELGMKGDFLDNTLRLNTAVFYNEYSDKQEEIIEPDGFGGSNTVVRNASDVELMGVEAELTWVATENLLFNVNLGYLDAEYQSFNADLNGDGQVTDNSDLELRRVPEWTGGINGLYTLQLGPGELSFYASYRYTDEYWVEVRNDPRGLVDDRGVLDATIAYDWEWSDGKTVRIALWGRDITDEVAYNSAVIVPETIAFSGVAGGEQYGLRISGNF